MGYRIALALVVGVVACAGQALAHHGAANYDMEKSVTIKGTVAEFVFTNPHTLIYLGVKESGGEVKKWQGELTSPNNLTRAGWTKSTIKPGQELTLVGAPAKSGAPLMVIQKVLLASGEELKTNTD